MSIRSVAVASPAPSLRVSPSLWNARTLFVLFALIGVNLAQCVSLVGRVEKGTDFTVFYNTSRLLDAGAGADIYRGTDQTTGWLRTIPPFGEAVIHPFSQGDVRAAALGWSVFNLALLAATAWSLLRFTHALKGKARLFRAVWPHAILVLLALSPGSLQVGQFSVTFVACWVFALILGATRLRVGAWSAGALWALPIAIKIYPALLLAAPLLARRSRVWVVALLFVGLWTLLPFALYGARTGELSASFWSNAIVSPSGRVAESQKAGPPFNQGLDGVALRYLTANAPIQARYPAFPHLDLSRAGALRVATVARVLVVALSLGVGLNFGRRARKSPLWVQAMLLALMCAALYVILPGAKSRYAIYAFPAFWPLLCCAFAARRLHKPAFWAWSIFLVFDCLLLVQLMPTSLKVWGLGWLGALALWGCNLALLWRWSRSVAPASAFGAAVTL